MGNPLKGEFDLEASGKTYTLCFNYDALCRIEDATDKPFGEIAAELGQKQRLSLVRIFIHAGLFQHHPEMTLKEAGELVLACGGIGVALVKIAEAVSAAFPQQPEASGTPRPPNRATRRSSGKPS